jgi:hypothetical protein
MREKWRLRSSFGSDFHSLRISMHACLLRAAPRAVRSNSVTRPSPTVTMGLEPFGALADDDSQDNAPEYRQVLGR